jgi:ribose/xylose/arabinose/galactoside ABC-type transport system permease subunit
MLLAAGIAGLIVGQTYWVLRSSLIPGLFGYSVFRGIAFNISDVSLSVSTQSSGILRAFGSPRWSLMAQLSVLGVFVVMWSISARTDVGRRWRAVGLDARWANHAGINVRKTRLLAQCVAGVMAGVAATMAASRIGTVGPEVGDEVLLTAPVAAVIGNGGLARWAPAPSRVVVASFLLATLRSELSLVGLGPDRVTMIVGLIGFATLLVERVFGRTWRATPIA